MAPHALLSFVVSFFVLLTKWIEHFVSFAHFQLVGSVLDNACFCYMLSLVQRVPITKEIKLNLYADYFVSFHLSSFLGMPNASTSVWRCGVRH